MFGALEALIGVHYFTDILRKIVRMCEQCVPGRIFRPGNEAMRLDALHLSYPVLREMRSSCVSSEEFQPSILGQRGIWSKALSLRQRLANIVPS